MSKKMKAAGRTLTYLRKLGYHVDKVEQWVPQPEGKGQRAKFAGGFRRDAFGFMDVLAFRPSHPFQPLPTPERVVAIQCTTRRQIADHLRNYRRDAKIREKILDWLACGCAFVIHGWWQEKVENTSCPGTHTRWRLDERQVTSAMLELTPADEAAIEREQLTPAPTEPQEKT